MRADILPAHSEPAPVPEAGSQLVEDHEVVQNLQAYYQSSQMLNQASQAVRLTLFAKLEASLVSLPWLINVFSASMISRIL